MSQQQGGSPVPRIFAVEHRGSSVIIRRLGTAYRCAYAWGAGFSAVLLILLAVYIRVARTHPGFWWLAGLVFIVFLALAARAQGMARALPQDAVTVDRGRDEVVRNGEVLGEPGDLEKILLLRAMDGTRPTGEMALLLAFRDTRTVQLGATAGVPGEQEAVRAGAQMVADALRLPVVEEDRPASEWWFHP